MAIGSTAIKTTKAPKAPEKSQQSKKKAHDIKDDVPVKANKAARGSDDGVGDEEIDNTIVKYDTPSEPSYFASKGH